MKTKLPTATTEENIEHVHHMTMDDRQTMNQIVNAINIPNARIGNILHNEKEN